MSSDLFVIFEKNDVELSGHVGLLLKTLGYSSLRAVAMINDKKIGIIEECVRKVLASESALRVKSNQEKMDMFGPIFCHSPSEFQFLPGERDTIVAAGIAANKMLLQYEVDDCRRKKARKSRKNPCEKCKQQINNSSSIPTEKNGKQYVLKLQCT
jgi:hypothetical protein